MAEKGRDQVVNGAAFEAAANLDPPGVGVRLIGQICNRPRWASGRFGFGTRSVCPRVGVAWNTATVEEGETREGDTGRDGEA